MIVMGLKGGSWVGDMYQKFEAMCVEVEEALHEDTFKCVENQIHTVGETVKKFCSDVVQDFLPPSSSDPVKGEGAHSSVGHQGEVKISKKPKVGDENGSEKSLEDFGVASSYEDSLNYVSYCSPIFSVIPCKPKSFNSSVEKSAKVNYQSQGTDLVLSNQAPSDTKHLTCSKDSKQESPPSGLPGIDDSITNSFGEVASIVPRNRSDESTSVHEQNSSMEVPAVTHNEDDGLGICRDLIECYGGGDVVKVKEIGFLSHGHITDLNGHLSTDLPMMEADLSASVTSTVENTIEVDKELSTCDIEKSSPFPATKFRICEADEEGFLVEQLNEVKLGESCVLVEKNVKFSQSGLISAQKSYKKKIQDMLSPKRWSKSKDQEQLAAWYEEQCEKDTVSTTMQAELRKSLISKTIESDWELV